MKCRPESSRSALIASSSYPCLNSCATESRSSMVSLSGSARIVVAILRLGLLSRVDKYCACATCTIAKKKDAVQCPFDLVRDPLVPREDSQSVITSNSGTMDNRHNK